MYTLKSELSLPHRLAAMNSSTRLPPAMHVLAAPF